MRAIGQSVQNAPGRNWLRFRWNVTHRDGGVQTGTIQERTAGGIVARVASVRKCSHRDAGASTEGDTGRVGTGRRCMGVARLLAAAAAAGLPQLEG